MPALQGTIRVVSAIDADSNIRALFVDENDNLVVNRDIRAQLAIAGATHKYNIGVVENAGSTIYTVPAGKTFYLCDISLSILNGDASPQFGYLYVYSNLAALKAGWRIGANANQGDGYHVSLVIPIAMSVGWYLNMNSPAAGCKVTAYYGGLEL